MDGRAVELRISTILACFYFSEANVERKRLNDK